MTIKETERLTRVETNQDNMAKDLLEMKQDIKDIKDLLRTSSGLFVTKKFATGFASVAISVATLWVLFLNYIHNGK